MLKKGDEFPDFSYQSYDGNTKDLYAQIGQGPAAILFLRYVGCTKCQLDIHTLLSCQKEIAEKGVQVFVVFQSAPSTVRESLTDFPFEIICDPIQALYKRFDRAARPDQRGIFGCSPLCRGPQGLPGKEAGPGPSTWGV